MVVSEDEPAGRNRAVQVELYGEPLGELFRRIGETLGLTQARLATIIGISAPMLSQLMSGRRAKIGHPMVVQRVQALHELVEQVATERATPEVVRARLEEIQATTGGAFTGGSLAGGRADAPTEGRVPSSSGMAPGSLAGLEPRTGVHVVQAMLRAVSGADELLKAVELLRPGHPELAEFIRIYGAGRTSEALQHYERIRADI